MNTHVATPASLPDHSTERSLSPLTRSTLIGWIVLLGVGPVLLLLLKYVPALDAIAFHSPVSHALIAGETSLLGTALALLVLRAAYRAQDGRLFLTGMGFLSLASLFFISFRLSTPEAISDGATYLTSWTALLSLILGSIFFGLSGLNIAPTANHRLMRHAGMWLVIYLVFWLIYSWLYLVLWPSLATTSPLAQPAWMERLRMALTAISLGCYIFAVGQHYLIYRSNPSQTGLAITCGIALFGEALITQQAAQIYSASFWLYHVQEAAGFTMISYAVLRAYRRGQSDEGVLESLLLSTTRQRIHTDYAQAMEALLDAFARGEPLTPEARLMLQQRFGLTQSQLLVVERAASTVAEERQQRQMLERLNQALVEVEHSKEQLTQMIVHDLKNPLTAQLGFLELLRRGNLSDDQRMLVEGALHSGRNLTALVNDLLDVARLESGRLHLERTPFAPATLLQECAAEMQPWVTSEDKTIRIEASPDLPSIRADHRLMQRMLLNLLSNAIKHTPIGTQITLRAFQIQERTEEGGKRAMLAFEVEDNGHGIPPERMAQIFDKFGATHTGKGKRQSSTGVGLAFCRLAIEAHGGSISVSNAPQRGAIFRLTLPIA